MVVFLHLEIQGAMKSYAQMTGQLPDEPKRRERKWLRLLLDFLLIIVVLFGVQWWMQRGMASGDAPEFTANRIDGESVSLASYQGKPLLLHFWASWCPFCNFEQSSITSLQEDWQVLTIAYQSGDKNEVEKFMKEKGIQDWKVIVDQNSEIAKKYGVTGVPATYIIDSEGKIRFKEAGLTSKWGLQLRMWITDRFL
jgi:peroxiredoxin